MSDDLRLQIDIAASESASASISRVTREVEQLNRKLKASRSVAELLPGAKDITIFKGVNKALKDSGEIVERGLNKQLREARKQIKDGSFGNWFTGLRKGVDGLDRAIKSSAGSNIKLTKQSVQMIKSYAAGLQAIHRHHDKELGYLERIEEKEGEIAVRRSRETERHLRAKREIEKEDEKAARRAARANGTSSFVGGNRWGANAGAHVAVYKSIKRQQDKIERDRIAALRQRMNIRINSINLERREAEKSRKQDLRLAMANDKIRWSARKHNLETEYEYALRMSKVRPHLGHQVQGSIKSAWHRGAHAVRSMSHPYFSSPAFLAEAALTSAILGLTEIMNKAAAYDKSVTDLAIRGRMSESEAGARGLEARSLASQYGVGAEHFVNIQMEALSRGIAPDLAKEIGPMIMKYAEATGQRPEATADATSDFIQQLVSMHKISDGKGVYAALNTAAAIANSLGGPEKMTQAMNSGLAERGSELNLSPKDMLTLAGVMNSSGVRTGQFTTRAMGILSKSAPNWKAEWLEKVQSGNMADPRVRAFIGAPRSLGYGNMDQMVHDAHGGNGLAGIARFFSSFRNIQDANQRKMLEEQLGFTEQVGGIVESFVESPEKMRRALGIAEDANRNDELSIGQAKYRKSLQYVEGVFDSVFENMSISIEGTLKRRVLLPFVGTWEQLSEWSIHKLPSIVNSVIDGFVGGLGFRDFRGHASIQKMIDSMSDSVRSVDWTHVGTDIAHFFKGVGEGISAITADLKYAFGFFGKITGDGTAEGIGRIATEMFGLALAIHAFTPVIAIIGSITSMFAAVASTFAAIRAASALAAAGGALAEGGAAAAGGAAALGIFPVTLAAIAAGLVISVAVMNWGEIKQWFSDAFTPTFKPEDIQTPKGAPNPTGESASEYWKKKNAYMHRSSYEGEGFGGLIQKASYQPSDSADIALDAMTGTERGTWEIKASVDRLAEKIGAIGGLGASGGDSGGAGDFGSGSGRPNMRFGRSGGGGSPALPSMRYGHNPDGSYRVTPHGGKAGEFGPHVSLGKMGAKFAAKAPVIMDGLMKKYGLTREQAAGIVGNLGHESAGFTAYHEGGQAPGSGGVGWAQWTGSRRRAFEAWTKAHGLDPTSDEASWRYLTEGDPETAKAILAVKRTNNRRDATRAWHDSFERSADISHGVIVKPKSWNSRLNYADKAFSMSEKNPGGATVAGEKPLGSPGNPATVKVDPKSIPSGREDAGSIAGKVLNRTRPGSDDTPAAGRMVTADASSPGHHFEMHFHHQVADAHQHARAVARTIDDALGYRYHDVG